MAVDRFLGQQDRNEVGAGYLSKESEQAVRDYYSHLTTQMLGVGDSDIRRQTNQDVATIMTARQISSDSLEESIDLVAQIMSGSNHSLLAKSLATIAYTDISMENSYTPPEFWSFLRECIVTEPEPGGMEILAGTFYARMAFHLLAREDGEKTLRELDKLLVGQVTNSEIEKRKLAIHVSARVVASLLDEERLRMTLPTVVVHQGPKKDSLAYPNVGGYPYTLMYLPPGSLPKDEKLKEAVYYGMPHVSSGVLTRRMPRVLVGVEVAEKPKDIVAKSGNLISYPNRRFTHIYIRGLRKPAIPDTEAFRDERDYQRNKVMTDASFDSLSFIGAIRVTRYLEKRFKDIDSQEASSTDRGFRSVSEYRNEQKRIAANSAVERWVRKQSQPIIRVDGEEQSILSIALKESQRYDGDEEWGIDNAEDHLLRTIKALVLVNNAGYLFLRGEGEIATLYQNHIWEEELTIQDKLELALAILNDTKSPLWNQIPDNVQPEIAQAVYKGTELDVRTRRRLTSLVKSRIILRCETIMDTHEPLGLRTKRTKQT